MANEPDPLDSEWRALGRLSAAVHEALDKLELDRVANEGRIRASVRKMRWFRRAAVVGLIVGSIGLWAGWQANVATSTFRSQRAESRHIQCESDNTTAKDINRVNDTISTILSLAVHPNPNETPTQRVAVGTFLSRSRLALAEAHVPVRVCSPAALRVFYHNN